MDHLNERWVKVGEAVTAAVQATGVPLTQVAARAGVSDKFIRALMAGTSRRYGAKTAALGAVFGWKPDWLSLILLGAPVEMLPVGTAEEERVVELSGEDIGHVLEALRHQTSELAHLQLDLRRLEALVRKLALATEGLGLELDDDDALPDGATGVEPTAEEGPR